MKILWASPNLLHPTTKGGQIRTLEMMRILRQRHEIHYVTFTDGDSGMAEGLQRSDEYCSRLYTLARKLVSKHSPRFALQLAAGMVSELPIAIGRYDSLAMRTKIGELLASGRFDRAVCDFLVSARYFPDLSRCLFFPHNVETLIWRRHAETASDAVRRWYFRGQAAKMFRYEQSVARQAGHIVAVSEKEAGLFCTMFGARRAGSVDTGVNLEYFTPPSPIPEVPRFDLVFVGSMDYLPNIDGVSWFLREILPLIRRSRPEVSVAITGRGPSREILSLAAAAGATVTGTVPDVRPYLWGSRLSIVPLRIGGGTRLKIYEAMGARSPIVSTTIGAEGLAIHPPHDIRLADTAETFSAQVIELLGQPETRDRIADAAWRMVNRRFTWEAVTKGFERILEEAPLAQEL